jgi:galactokinase/mevalonate kinase-like predicted kinase
MSKIVPLKCPNCGANVPRETLKCEYCGTQFILSNNESTLEPMEPKVHVTREDVEFSKVWFYGGKWSDIEQESLDALLAKDKIDEETYEQLKQQLIKAHWKIHDIVEQNWLKKRKLERRLAVGKIDEKTCQQLKLQMDENCDILVKPIKEEYYKSKKQLIEEYEGQL